MRGSNIFEIRNSLTFEVNMSVVLKCSVGRVNWEIHFPMIAIG
jgi:hypothetical protein